MILRTLGLFLLLALLTGCASAADLVNALAADGSSACVAVKATLYGHVVACRTNAERAVIIADPATMQIQHQGAR